MITSINEQEERSGRDSREKVMIELLYKHWMISTISRPRGCWAVAAATAAADRSESSSYYMQSAVLSQYSDDLTMF